MIAWKIASVIFMTTLTLSIVDSMFFAQARSLDSDALAGMPMAPDPRWQQKIDDASSSWNISQQNVGDINPGYGDVIAAGSIVIKAFADSTIFLPWFLDSLGLPAVVVILFTAIAALAYGSLGIFILSGRNIEE